MNSCLLAQWRGSLRLAESGAMRTDIPGCPSSAGLMADKMVETRFSENPFLLVKQALGIFTPEKAGIHRLIQGILNPET